MIAIGITLALVGAVTIVATVVRAFPRLRTIPPSPLRSRELALKERIIIERMSRSIRAWGNTIGRSAQGRFRGWGETLQRGYRKLRLRAQEESAATSGGARATCADFLAAAEAAIEQDDDARAEEEYLACLKLDAKHREAYLGLSRLYRRKREDGLAEETLRFLRRLYPDDAETAYELADALRARGKHAAALREIQHALTVVPKHPKYLDFAIAAATMVRRRKLAEQLLAQLKEVNPENQKIAEFEERIAGIET